MLIFHFLYGRIRLDVLTLAIAAILLSLLHAETAHGANHSNKNNQTNPSDENEIQLVETPIEFHRRASQLLEEMRGGPIAPNWADAQLADRVRLLYRPDIEANADELADPIERAAYLEFKLVGADGGDRGFIILATAAHDFPIPHWDDTGQTPTEWVEQEALQNRKQAVKFYKIDVFSYAGETADGELAAMPGNDPIKISGLTDNLVAKAQGYNGSASWESKQPDSSNDASEGEFTGLASSSGSQSAPLEFSEWESWQALKDSFEDAYGPLAADLASLAAEAWDIERNIEQYGQGLIMGNSYTFSLLQNDAPEITLNGAGSDSRYVSINVREQASGPALLQISVLDADPSADLPLEITIDHASSAATSTVPHSAQETLRFFLIYQEPNAIFGEDTQTIFLPLIVSPNSASGKEIKTEIPGQTRAVSGSWSTWNWHSAGSWADQRRYTQLPEGHADNPHGCATGCGPTAWAMLFGWVDHQAAEGHPRWKNRSGIYRTNGSKNGSHTAVAPQTMNNEPGVVNIILEIREDVDTFCWGESGATAPWDMKQAQDYLDGRTAADLKSGWNSLGIHQEYLRKRVRDSIIKHDTPAIIGTGWLRHYPLAWRYKSRSRQYKPCQVCKTKTQWQYKFYVNQGWGGNDDGWVAASTWFAGEVKP